MSQKEVFTITFDDNVSGPPYPDCHCGRKVLDDKTCSGCRQHPLDCSCNYMSMFSDTNVGED